MKPQDELAGLYEAAEGAYDMFRGFMVGGFTEDQALSLVAKMIAASVTTDKGGE